MKKHNLLSMVALGTAVVLAACDAKTHQPVPTIKKAQPAARQPAVSAPAPEPAASAAPPPADAGAPAPSYAELMHKARTLSARAPEAAVLAYLEAAELVPASARPHIAICGLLIGQGEAELAREHAARAVKLQPELSRTWNTLGRVELMRGKLAAAERAFLLATRRNPGNVYAWNNLGLTRIRRQRYTEAVDALQEATAGEKPRAYMFNNLGIALERLDRVDEAMEAYKSGLALGSGVAGQNFVRLERELELQETAEADVDRWPADGEG